MNKEGEFQGELGEAGYCFLKYYFTLFPIPFFSTFSMLYDSFLRYKELDPLITMLSLNPSSTKIPSPELLL